MIFATVSYPLRTNYDIKQELGNLHNRAQLRERVIFVLRLISRLGATLHRGRRGGRPGVAARYTPSAKIGYNRLPDLRAMPEY